ncbi:MAG: glycosyltransferase family 4 protein [Clostridia bacterium]|nr:glycosyltransferase family 4 protein [Clostridia bacterium]
MEKKLKVMRVSATYPRDTLPGAGLHAYYYSMFSDYDEMIVTGKRDGTMFQNREGVEVVEVELDNVPLGKYDENIFARVLKFIRKNNAYNQFAKSVHPLIDAFKPDVIHVVSPMTIKCGIYARKKYGTKIVMSLHGSDALRMKKKPLIGKYILRIPDAVVTVGENMIDLLPLGRSYSKPVVCVGNGVDLTVFQNNKLPRKKQFIHVASLRWQKAQHILLEGFAKFYEQHQDYTLKMIGDGERREELCAMCEQFGISHAVEFCGIQNRSVIANELNQSRAFVLTSVTEGFPKVIIEAMATATPVLSSDVGNIASVVQDSGIIFPPSDSQSVCNAMTKIADDNTLWDAYSKKSEIIAQQYGWGEVVAKLDALFRDLLQ